MGFPGAALLGEVAPLDRQHVAFNLRAQDVADRTFDHLSYGEPADSGRHALHGPADTSSPATLAAILGVNRARLNQLAAKDFIPFEVHADGTRLYRRQQLEVVANAREARRGSCRRTSTAPTQSKCCMPTATL